MKKSVFRRILLRGFALLAGCLAMFSLTAKAGGDSYEIYLNNKLILKQYQFQTLSLTSLNLNKSNLHDQLVIYYSQCNVKDATGKGRTIVIKNDRGIVLKEWKFSDNSDSRGGMVIPVKELLQLQKENAEGSLSIFYSAQGHPQSQILSSLKLTVSNAS
jgi:hypothetical protein